MKTLNNSLSSTIKTNSNNSVGESRKNKLEQLKTEFEKKLPLFIGNKINCEKYVKSVLFELNKISDEHLLKCSNQSILEAVKTAIDLELEIDSRQHCHLILFNGKAQLLVGYRGFIYAIKRVYPDANIVVNLVRTNDTFTVKRGNDIDEYDHVVSDPFDNSIDSMRGGYCYVSLNIGDRKVAKVETMSKSEILKAKSVAKTSKIWDIWFEEKAKVVVLKRACKILFAGLNNEMINKLINKDNEDYNLSEEKKEVKVIDDLPTPVNADLNIVELSEKEKEEIRIKEMAEALIIEKEGE